MPQPRLAPGREWPKGEHVSETYDDDEVREILHRALTEEDDAGLTHAELADIAAEVGVSTADLEAAAASVRSEREERSEEDEARAVLAKKTSRRRRGFLRHALTWAVVSTGLFLLDSVVPGSSWWFFPAIGWGIAVALQGVGVFLRDEDADLDREIKRLRRKKIRLEREAAQRAKAAKRKKRKKGGDVLAVAEAAFEDAIDRGLALLLQKAAEKLQIATEGGALPDTELGRFIARKKGSKVRVGESPESPRGTRRAQARVDASTGEDHEVEADAPRRRRERTASE